MKFGNNENWNGHLKTDIEKWKFSNNDEFARNVFWKKNTFEKGNNFEKNVIRKISKYFKTFFLKNWGIFRLNFEKKKKFWMIWMIWNIEKVKILKWWKFWKDEILVNFEKASRKKLGFEKLSNLKK